MKTIAELKTEREAALAEVQRAKDAAERLAKIDADLAAVAEHDAEVQRLAATAGLPLDAAAAEIADRRKAAAEQSARGSVLHMSPAEYRAYKLRTYGSE